MDYKINVLNEDVNIEDDVIEAANGDRILAKLFVNRGYSDAKVIREMMDVTSYTPTKPGEFNNMDLALDRVVKAIENNEKIAVYGDYDVDGVTSTVVLMTCLKGFTSNVLYHVPDRFKEGYGMNMKVIEALKAQDVDLIITCDCGISNINEISYAKELGMAVIVTDHHTIPENLPPADVILNPKLFDDVHRAKNISGCVMAYYLSSAIYEYYEMADKIEELLDVVIISIIADVVPLNGENRYLLKKGLDNFLNTERIGLRALIDVVQESSRIETEEDVAFQIAPRINAAGRMDSARLPVDMLLSDSYDEAKNTAQIIDGLNKQRKDIQQGIFEEAKDLVETTKREKEILVLYNDFWHHGIVGIVAGKICETYNKPAILLSLKDDMTTIVGSARSTEDINIYDLIKKCEKYLLKFGGHSQAAGLSLDKDQLDEFVKNIEKVASLEISSPTTKIVNVDYKLDFEQIDGDFYEKLRRAGPYGEGFAPPLFVSREISVLSDRITGKNHHIMVLEDKRKQRMKAVKWFGDEESYQGRVFDFVYKVSKNSFRGNDEIQINSELLVESSGIKRDIFSGKIVDLRKYDLTKALENLQAKNINPLVFYEGAYSNLALGVKTVNRDSIMKTESLLLLSPPINMVFLKEIIAYCDPKWIFLSFLYIPEYSFKEFVLNGLKLIKSIVNDQEGKILLGELSMKLMIEENITNTLLNYLDRMGLIEYEISNEYICLHLVKKEQKTDKVYYEKELKKALKEKEAYNKFVCNLEIKRFKEYINA